MSSLSSLSKESLQQRIERLTSTLRQQQQQHSQRQRVSDDHQHRQQQQQLQLNIITNTTDYKSLLSDLECPICGDLYNIPSALANCGHIFCSECIHITLKSQRTEKTQKLNETSAAKKQTYCPHCREPADRDRDVLPHSQLERLTLRLKHLRTKILEQEQQQQAEADDAVNDGADMSPSKRPSRRRRTVAAAAAAAAHNDGDDDDDVVIVEKHHQQQRHQLQTLPRRSYNQMKKKQLVKLCKDYGLSTVGTERDLRERHAAFVLLWNSNCGSVAPRSRAEIAREINDRELAKKREAMLRPSAACCNSARTMKINHPGFRILIDQYKQRVAQKQQQQQQQQQQQKGDGDVYNTTATTNNDNEKKMPAALPAAAAAAAASVDITSNVVNNNNSNAAAAAPAAVPSNNTASTIEEATATTGGASSASNVLLGDNEPLSTAGEYDVSLPITSEGVLIKITSQTSDDGHLNFVFNGYRAAHNGSKGPAEQHSLIQNVGDQIILVDGIPTAGASSLDEVSQLFCSKTVNKHHGYLPVRFRDKNCPSTASSSGSTPSLHHAAEPAAAGCTTTTTTMNQCKRNAETAPPIAGDLKPPPPPPPPALLFSTTTSSTIPPVSSSINNFFQVNNSRNNNNKRKVSTSTVGSTPSSSSSDSSSSIDDNNNSRSVRTRRQQTTTKTCRRSLVGIWTCDICTYINNKNTWSRATCEMCTAKRPAATATTTNTNNNNVEVYQLE